LDIKSSLNLVKAGSVLISAVVDSLVKVIHLLLRSSLLLSKSELLSSGLIEGGHIVELPEDDLLGLVGRYCDAVISGINLISLGLVKELASEIPELIVPVSMSLFPSLISIIDLDSVLLWGDSLVVAVSEFLEFSKVSIASVLLHCMVAVITES